MLVRRATPRHRREIGWGWDWIGALLTSPSGDSTISATFSIGPPGRTRMEIGSMDLQLAADQLASDLERLAGALDQSNNNRAAVRELLDDAGRELAEAFAAFGSALARDLAAAFIRKRI